MAIIHLANSMSAVKKAMQRECPGCHTKQEVAFSKARQAVACKKCGASIPAKTRVEDR
jgi:ribosomal protein S27E